MNFFVGIPSLELYLYIIPNASSIESFVFSIQSLVAEDGADIDYSSVWFKIPSQIIYKE